MHGPVRAAVAAGLVAAAAASGCGGGSADSEREQVRSAVRTFFRAIAAGDGSQACAAMTAAARRQFTENDVRQGRPGGTCTQVVERNSRTFAGRDLDRIGREAAAKIAIRGDAATATTTSGRRLGLTKVDGRWRLSDLTG